MSGYVVLLRGINVGGKNLVAMSDLRALAEAEGYAGAKTLLQSGNLVFHGAKRTSARVEAGIEAALKKRLRVAVDVMVRTDAEWGAIVAGNPFAKEAKADPARLVVVCLKSAPAASAVKALVSAIPGGETLRAKGRELYVYYPDGQGNSKLTPALMDRHLGARGTARNWNTVEKIARLLAAGTSRSSRP